MHNDFCKAVVCLLVMIVIGCGQDSKSVSDQVKTASHMASLAASDAADATKKAAVEAADATKNAPSKAADKTHPNATIYVDRESAALLSAETKAALGASL